MEPKEKRHSSWKIPMETKNETPVKPRCWDPTTTEIKLENEEPRTSRWEGTAPWQKTMGKKSDWSSQAQSSPSFKINKRGDSHATANNIVSSGLLSILSMPSTSPDHIGKDNVKIDHRTDGGPAHKGRGLESRPAVWQAEPRPRLSLTEGTREIKIPMQQKLPLGPIGSPRIYEALSQSTTSTTTPSVKKTVRWQTPSPWRQTQNAEDRLRSGTSDGDLSPNPAIINSSLKGEPSLESVSCNQTSNGSDRCSSRDSSPASSGYDNAFARATTRPFLKIGRLQRNEPSGWAIGALVKKVSGLRDPPKAAVVFSSYANAVKKDILETESLKADMRRIHHSPTQDKREMLVGSFRKTSLRQDSDFPTGFGNSEQNKNGKEVEEYLHKSDPFELEGFRPSSMSQEKAGLIEPPTGNKYLGNLDSLSAALQIQDLPADQNCALWVTHISPHADLAAFLASVRTGAVFAVLLSEPQRDHWTKAAKLVFMKHDSAAEFLGQINSFEGVVICGVRINAIWNRNGYCENRARKSRVIHIIGPKDLMSFEKWTAYFNKCVCFELETWRNLPEGNRHKKKMEFRFSRIDGQAEAIYQAISRNPRLESVEVKYAPDPCDPESIFK